MTAPAACSRCARRGGRTLGQDESTCVVYGMPRAAFELGAVERQLPLERLGPAIRNLTNKETER